GHARRRVARERGNRRRQARSSRGERHREDLVETRKGARQDQRHQWYPWTPAKRIVRLALNPKAPGGEQKTRQRREIREGRQENGEHLADLAREIDEPLHGRASLLNGAAIGLHHPRFAVLLD